MAATKDTQAQIVVERLNRETIDVPIIGSSPLIMHNWSPKQKRAMLEAQQGVKKVKQHRNPTEEYESSFYRIDPGSMRGDFVLERPDNLCPQTQDEIGHGVPGFPSLGFKSGMVDSARHFGKSVTMVQLKQSVFVDGILSKSDAQRLVEIVGEPWMREDVATIGMGSRDLRYRAQFDEWHATLRVTYVASTFSQDAVLSFLDAAGMTVGVGEWRPEKGGEFGCYAIDPAREITVYKGR
jgi:hypothetical protein